MIKFLDLNKQYLSIKNEIDHTIQTILSESAFIGGKYVKAFEDAFAKYQQANFCIGVANGTDALEIAIEALDLPQNSEIIVPANSFIASSESVTRSGHQVIFCDCNEDYLIDMNHLKSKITEKTKAIIVVHLYGQPANMAEILTLSKEFNLKIIEDCAQAHGAEYQGKKVGSIGDIGTFSFYPGKNLGAYGDGGAIITNDQNLAKKCRMIANHGRIDKYNHEFEGRNSRLDGLQAGILSVKLNHLDEWTLHRIKISEVYRESLKPLEHQGVLKLPIIYDDRKHVYHLFVIQTRQRDQLSQHLKSKGIDTGIHYPIALPNLKAYENLNQTDCVMASNNESQLLSLPIGEHLSFDDINDIIEQINLFFYKNN